MNSAKRMNSNFLNFFLFIVFSFQQNKQYPNEPIVYLDN